MISQILFTQTLLCRHQIYILIWYQALQTKRMNLVSKRDISSFRKAHTYNRHNLTHRIIHHFLCIRLPRATLEITFLYTMREKRRDLISINFNSFRCSEMKIGSNGQRTFHFRQSRTCVLIFIINHSTLSSL